MNFGTPVPLLIGIILILGALALFFLDKFRPGYERDADKVYAVLLMISGLFLLAHLDMELLASFQQLLMAGMLTTLLVESIRSRDPRENILREPMNDRRPPRPPRYDERPPVRRGYRAELDERSDFRPEFRDRPAQPRMNPSPSPYPQAAYPQEAYASRQVRPPYEEYRGPAGQLQPSRSGPNSSNNRGPNNSGPSRPAANSPGADTPPNSRYSDGSRYGERPPAPQQPASEQYRSPESFRGAESAPRPDDRSRSQERMPQGRVGERPPRPTGNGSINGAGNGSEGDSDMRSENGPEGGLGSDLGSGRSPARALNIRPLSEAPKFDDSYRPDGEQSGSPEGAPS